MRNVHDNVLSCVGDTPIVRLNSVVGDLKSTVYVKLEMLNPGGSIKDRIAMQIIADAEARGELKPGNVIVEGTSGNTGAGLAMAGAVKGYPCTFVMPDKQSEEKRAALRAYGAKVVVTPTAVEPEDERSYYSVSTRLGNAEGAYFANQYHNPSNPEAHYRSTAPEIMEQIGEELDAIIIGLGTGGTASGIGRYFKEHKPSVQIIGVDPVGSLYYDYFHTGQMTAPYTYIVEGIGEDFMPSTVDWSVIDDVVRVDDGECMRMTRRVVQEEGILCGGSCGAAVAGALKWVQRNDKAGQKVLVIMPDSGNRYLSKIFNDNWMQENGFLEAGPGLGSVKDLRKFLSADRSLISVPPSAMVTETIGVMKLHGVSRLPVLEDGQLLGVVSETSLLERALRGGGGNTRVRELATADYTTVEPESDVSVLMELFKRAKVAFVIRAEGKRHDVLDIITRIDLLDYIASKQ